MTVEERKKENDKNQKISIVAGGKFTKSMPEQFDSDGILNEGDIIIMPDSMPVVYSQEFGIRTNADGTTSPATGEFIIVNVQNIKGEIRAINFFPSSFTKNIWPAVKDALDEVTTVLEDGPLNPLGTAVDKYLESQGKGTENATDMQLGVESLLGKKIKISKKKPVDVQAWKNGSPVNRLRKSYQLTYDFVS